MNTTTTDKIQVGDSTNGTSTSTTYYTNPSYQAEKGWECPRCGRINAPWISHCDCSKNNYWINGNYEEPWWKRVYCDSDTFRIHPETTTWKAPSSVCDLDSATTAKTNPNETTTLWSSANDMINKIDHITTTTYYNTGDAK